MASHNITMAPQERKSYNDFYFFFFVNLYLYHFLSVSLSLVFLYFDVMAPHVGMMAPLERKAGIGKTQQALC